MVSYFLVGLLGQVPVAGNVVYHTAACNAANTAGYLPVKVDFECQIQSGQIGCQTEGVVALNYWNGNEYPRFCQIMSFGNLPPLDDARTIISGIEMKTSGPVLSVKSPLISQGPSLTQPTTRSVGP